MNAKLPSCLLLLCLALAACGESEEAAVPAEEPLAEDDGTGPPSPPETLTATIGAEGGTIEGEAGGPFAGFRLVVPAGALAAETTLTVDQVIDPTPLGEQAERVGPQLRIGPAGVTFAQPASLTVPYDPVLRRTWDVPDAECRVWFRQGEGWANAEQTASDEDSVTVPLQATTVVAAGVVRGIQPVACLSGCTSSTPATPACRDGATFCMTRIGAHHVAAMSGYSSYTKGVLYWLTVPAADTVALAGFDVLTRAPIATSQRLATTTTNAVGEVVVDDAGARWLTLRGFGTIRFSGAPTRFDGSTTTRPFGVLLDKSTGEVVRFRYQRDNPQRDRVDVTLVRNGRVRRVATMVGGDINIDTPAEVVQLGRSLSTDSGYLVRARTWGALGQPALSVEPVAPESTPRPGLLCGERPRARTNVLVAAPGEGLLTFCHTDSSAGPAQSWLMQAPGSATRLLDPPSGSFELDGDGIIWNARTDRASVVRYTPDGGETEIPLTDAAVGTAAYTAMIPRSIHYDLGLDTLYVVTRGTGNVPEIHEVTNLR